MGIQFNGFSAIGQSFESAVSIINSVSSSLAALITPVLLFIVAIWIIAYGLATMRGEVQQPIMQMVGRYYRLALFMACGLSMGVFQGQIVPAVMDLQTGLAAAAGKSMNSMSGMCTGSATNPYAMLDCYGSAALALVGAYFNQAVADGTALAIGAALVDAACGLVILIGVTLYGVIMALEFIEAQPEGFQTKVGERGGRLSGGQRQRVSIARAFLKDAPVLILDEATSALDTDTERSIQQSLALLMKGRTTLIVAHRFSTIRDVGRVLVFDAGRIVADGPREQVYASSELFRRLWDNQSKDLG